MSTIKELLKVSTDSVENEKTLNTCLERIVDKDDIVIDSDIVSSLLLFLKAKSDSYTLVLKVIATLARNETNRPLLADKELLQEILKYISSETADECLQALRSACNISAENDKAKEIFSDSNGVKLLMEKSEKVLNSDDSSWNQIICPACSCIQNLIDESESLQEKFLTTNALDILVKFLLKFYKQDLTISTSLVNGISSLADSESGLSHMKQHNAISRIVETFHDSSNEYISMVFENLLTEYGNKENTRLLLVESGCIETLHELTCKRANFQEKEVKDPVMKVMADLIVMLTSGEGSFDLLLKKEKDVLGKFSKWIESPNRHIQVSAGLALGNYARSEETCAELVKNGIHENMINVIKENITDEKYSDRFEAYTSCLRNLTIPVTNKPILIQAGLPEVATELIKTSTLPVQFKTLAILRLIVQGHDDLATKLLLDEDLIKKVCELSETSAVSSVPSEAQRLIAALVKYSNSENPIRVALACNCLQPIVKLLSSDHMLMKNEGLIGLIMMLANVNDCLDKIKESECLSKVLKLLQEDDAQAQTLFNALTFLQALSSVDGGKASIKENEFEAILQKLTSHGEEIIRSKATETLGILTEQ